MHEQYLPICMANGVAQQTVAPVSVLGPWVVPPPPSGRHCCLVRTTVSAHAAKVCRLHPVDGLAVSIAVVGRM